MRGKDKLRESVNGATESCTVLDCGLRRIAPDDGPRQDGNQPILVNHLNSNRSAASGTATDQESMVGADWLHYP